MLIGLDVDGVVVDTVTGFLASGSNEDYWRQTDLYDHLEPHIDIAAVILRLQQHGDVIFLSTCFEEHLWSKWRFLKNHFPTTPLINIHNKALFPVDLLVDDRQIVIDGFRRVNPSSQTILTTYSNTLRDIQQAGY